MLALLFGCATTKAPPPSAEEVAGQGAEAEAARRVAWLEKHRDVVLQLMARAEALEAAKGELLSVSTSWRVGYAVLEQAAASCPSLLSEMEGFAEALSGQLDAYGDQQLPGLVEGWQDLEGLGEQRTDLRARCEALPGLISTAEQALAVEAEAEQARDALAQGRRTGPATDSVAAADAVLREIVGHTVFVDYLDAIDAWQVAATVALRESRKGERDEARLQAARTAELQAEHAVGALNATITLAISGRSNELNDAIAAAVKALKRLKEDEQQAVLALFPPEVTPASLVLLQLVQDRL